MGIYQLKITDFTELLNLREKSWISIYGHTLVAWCNCSQSIDLMFVSVCYVCSISDKQDFRGIMSLNVSSWLDLLILVN